MLVLLAINEEFLSFQGEGKNVGVLQYFIRTQGCSVGCYFCDTKQSWRESEQTVAEELIVKRALDTGCEWITITGGEPLEQDISKLVYLAKEHGLKIQIETSGMFESPILDKIDWICCSPKMLFSKIPYKDIFDKVSHEIKCIITQEKDVDFYVDKYKNFKGVKTFQLVEGKEQELAKILLDKRISDWKVMIQQHKVMMLR